MRHAMALRDGLPPRTIATWSLSTSSQPSIQTMLMRPWLEGERLSQKSIQVDEDIFSDQMSGGASVIRNLEYSYTKMLYRVP